MFKRKKMIIFLLSCLLAGCAGPISVRPTTLSLPIINPTVSITVTSSSPVEHPTPIIYPATTTSAPTAVGIRWSKDVPVSPCLLIQNPVPELRLPWLVLGDIGGIDGGMSPHVLDPNNGTKTDQLVPSPDNVKSQLFYGYHLSPDGKWLAYIHVDERNYYTLIVEPVGNILTKSTKGRILLHPGTYFSLVDWVSNESLAIVLQKDHPKFYPTLIINPFSGQQREFSLYDHLPNALDYQLGTSGSLFFRTSNLMPDSTLTRLVYLTEVDNRIQITLWDMKNKKILANLTMNMDHFNSPLWSLDGSDFLIQSIIKETNGDLKSEWFQITREGDIRQLTHFDDFLKNVHYLNASRSWDGHYLTLHIIYDGDKDGKYLILDLTTQNPQGFCVDASWPNGFDYNVSPVWSPDNKYVIVAENDQNALNWVLVNVEKQEAYQIAKDVNFHAVGWMAVAGPLPSVTSTP